MSRARPATSRRPLRVDVSRRTAADAPGVRSIATWAAAALGPRGVGAELSVQLVSPAASRRLNRDYRGKDRPTNVLSFPSTAPVGVMPRPLGDIVVKGKTRPVAIFEVQGRAGATIEAGPGVPPSRA